MVSSALNRLAPIDFTRYIDRLTERFTGREWLFEQIDRWLHQGNEQFYLLTGEPGVGKSAIAAKLTQIRSDIAAYHFCRAGDVETVRPGRVLRSLAAQLGKTLPHYGEALAKTIDPIRLRIDVNINIESLSNSQVTGIYIENLKESDPREELEILLRAPLAALPDLYAEHNEPLPTLKILLIDSLDEAVTTTGRDNMATLLAALSQVDGLPSWIRFILTARPDLRVLQQFELMKLYKLEELLTQNLEDIERYVGDRVEELVVQPESEFQARLEQAELSGETLVREVKELSKGNFLYTRLLMDGIGTGELSLKNLSILPKTLNEVYQRFLRHRCPFRKWSDRYQSILGTLTVTQEAVTQERLVKFTGVDSKQVQDVIGILQQFLDEAEDEQGQKRYAIFHQSLREYLLNKKYNQDFWCDAKEQHDSIIDCYDKESESWQELRQIDQYGLRHLAQHLVKADRAEELHTLLSLEKNGCNAWFDIKNQIGDIAGVLEDVQLAWVKADEEFKKNPAKTFGRQCRYALIRTSINTLAEIPVALMVALVKHKHWTPTTALAYAHQCPDPQKRAGNMTALAEQLSDAELLKHQALKFALEAAETIDINFHRTRTLTVLFGRLPLDLLPKALEAAQTTKSESDRAELLIALFNRLSPDLLSKALEAVQAINDERFRTQAMAALAGKMPYLLPKVLETTQTIDDVYYRAEILIALANKLTPDLLDKALQVALSIEDEGYRARTLTALTNKLPNVIPEALEAAQSIKDTVERAYVLRTLADKSPEALLKALEATQAIDGTGYRASALIALTEKLTPDLLPKALEVARSIADEPNLASAIAALAEKLAPDLLPKALEVAQNIEDMYWYAHTLTALANKLPDILPMALEAALAIEDKASRVYALIDLGEKLPYALSTALEVAQTIKHTRQRAEVMTALANELPDALPKALEAAQTIEDEKYCAEILTALADKLPDVLPMALEAAQSIKDEVHRTWALAVLADKLTPDLFPIALEAAQAIEYEGCRAYALTVLVDEPDPELLLDALEAVESIRSVCQVDGLPILVNKLASNLLPIVLDAAQRIDYENYRAEILSILANKLTPELLPIALKTAQAIEDEFARFRALNALADTLPDTLPQALETAQSLADTHWHAWGLIELADKLTPDLVPKALEAAQAIGDESDRAQALTALADKLPDALFQALEAAQSIADASNRAWALTALVDKLPDALPKVLETIESIEYEELRRQALVNLANKLPDAIPKALESVLFIKNGEFLGRALTGLADKLTPNLLPEVLKTVQYIEYEQDRAKALKALVPRLVDTADCFDLWKDLLHALSYRTRPHMLTDLITLTPVILALGGEDALAETAKAIQDVARWWR